MSRNRNPISSFVSFITLIIILFLAFQAYQIYNKYFLENKILKEIVARLEADSRIAEVLVTDVQTNESGQPVTTIKFLEYGSQGLPLAPKYFTFTGNVIQFQSLVVRFDDVHVQNGDKLRGKSAYVFWKVFILDGARTQEQEINKFREIPAGYKINGPATQIEQEFWQNFWGYALDTKLAKMQGIKNAQIEAPGTRFVPGLLYTLKIEHDGGIRIDVSEIPIILKGEKILN